VFVIFAGPKLRGVYKNRHYNYVTHPARFTHETEVTFMQRAHRRYQPDGSILLAANLARDRTHALTAIYDLHSQ
jgi:hypothetical protein